MKKPYSYIILKSQDDPDSLGPSIADTFNLTAADCFEILQDKSLPHHMVMFATSLPLRPRYAFAYTMFGRILHNKRYLHQVSVDSPIHTFPFWKIIPTHLLHVRKRLYEELSFEAAELCMEIFQEIIIQARNNQQISVDEFDSLNAICTERIINRRNFQEEFPKITQTVMAQCMLAKLDHVAQRDAAALALVYSHGTSAEDLARLTIHHLSAGKKQAGISNIHVKIPAKPYSVRNLILGDLSSTFLSRWLGSNLGVSVFCHKNQFPACTSCTKKVVEQFLAARLRIVCKRPPTVAEFQTFFKESVYRAAAEQRLKIHARKLLLSQAFTDLGGNLASFELDGLQAFGQYMDSLLGEWRIPFKKE